MQTLKNMIEASLSKQEEMGGQRGTKNEDSCLQYINKTKSLLTFLIDEMDEEVFSCLQLGAVHKLRHFKIDLYGSSNNDST